jgi:ABC-2 type transport system ATP-binding protein
MPISVLMMERAISCRGLRKSFGSTLAVDGLDLEVGFGEIHGFLGPNGSGKTVTMRIILGLLRRSGGDISVLGGDPWEDAVSLHRRMAYVPGDTNLWPNLTGGEILDVLAGLRGGTDPTRTADLVHRFELDPRKKARSYSKGNRQKVALIAALASEADLLILDEPTSGLDPLMDAVFADEIRRARDAGRAVLLSSHELAEVEKLCDRVTIINQGRVVETGSMDQLRHLTRTFLRAQTMSAPTQLRTVAGVHDIDIANGSSGDLAGEESPASAESFVVKCEVETRALSEAVAICAQAGLRSLEAHPPTLEDLFMRHYSEFQG